MMTDTHSEIEVGESSGEPQDNERYTMTPRGEHVRSNYSRKRYSIQAKKGDIVSIQAAKDQQVQDMTSGGWTIDPDYSRFAQRWDVLVVLALMCAFWAL